jgi:polyhydroxyalkanoate synthesis regulator phasin
LNPTSKEIDAEIDRLREQVSRLQEEILRQSEESKQILKDNNRLLEEQKKLIEDKTRSDTLLMLADKEHEELQEVKQELSRYQRTLFGLYRKI